MSKLERILNRKLLLLGYSNIVLGQIYILGQSSQARHHICQKKPVKNTLFIFLVVFTCVKDGISGFIYTLVRILQSEPMDNWALLSVCDRLLEESRYFLVTFNQTTLDL